MANAQIKLFAHAVRSALFNEITQAMVFPYSPIEGTVSPTNQCHLQGTFTRRHGNPQSSGSLLHSYKCESAGLIAFPRFQDKNMACK